MSIATVCEYSHQEVGDGTVSIVVDAIHLGRGSPARRELSVGSCEVRVWWLLEAVRVWCVLFSVMVLANTVGSCYSVG